MVLSLSASGYLLTLNVAAPYVAGCLVVSEVDSVDDQKLCPLQLLLHLWLWGVEGSAAEVEVAVSVDEGALGTVAAGLAAISAAAAEVGLAVETVEAMAVVGTVTVEALVVTVAGSEVATGEASVVALGVEAVSGVVAAVVLATAAAADSAPVPTACLLKTADLVDQALGALREGMEIEDMGTGMTTVPEVSNARAPEGTMTGTISVFVISVFIRRRAGYARGDLTFLRGF